MRAATLEHYYLEVGSLVIAALSSIPLESGHRLSLGYFSRPNVENIRCGGNDSRLVFYGAERSGLCGDTMFVLCGDEDHNCLC